MRFFHKVTPTTSSPPVTPFILTRKLEVAKGDFISAIAALEARQRETEEELANYRSALFSIEAFERARDVKIEEGDLK